MLRKQNALVVLLLVILGCFLVSYAVCRSVHGPDDFDDDFDDDDDGNDSCEEPSIQPTTKAKDWLSVATPHLTRAALTENWDALDEGAEEVMKRGFKDDVAFVLFPHARDVFKHHLIGTFSILGQWGQPSDVKRTGLFHTAYSGDLFQFARWNAKDQGDRSTLKEIAGEEAEALIWLFGTLHRGKLADLGTVMRDDKAPDPLVPGSVLKVPHRLHGTVSVTAETAGKILTVTLADYLDQMVAVNGWRDHHQVEHTEELFPGILARPEIAFYWISKMCAAIRDVVEVIPPAFDNCTRTISRSDEESARDMYWGAVLSQSDVMSDDEKIEMFQIVHHLNPFVGEPHFMLSQFAYRRNNYEIARSEAKKALEKFYALGAAWDKRMTFQAWVAHARMMLVRANRRLQGKVSSLPLSRNQPPTSGGLPIVMLADIVDAFRL